MHDQRAIIVLHNNRSLDHSRRRTNKLDSRGPGFLNAVARRAGPVLQVRRARLIELQIVIENTERNGCQWGAAKRAGQLAGTDARRTQTAGRVAHAERVRLALIGDVERFGGKRCEIVPVRSFNLKKNAFTIKIY